MKYHKNTGDAPNAPLIKAEKLSLFKLVSHNMALRGDDETRDMHADRILQILVDVYQQGILAGEKQN